VVLYRTVLLYVALLVPARPPFLNFRLHHWAFELNNWTMCRSALLLATAILASATAGVRGAVVAHDSISVWPEPAPVDSAQYLAVKFKPLLDIVNGCQSYPAVDADGNTSGGLKPTGPSDGDCKDTSKAQVYARAGWYNNAYGIMYAWYMPKDSPSSGLGHRHEWENSVVWLDSANPSTAAIVAMATSAHGKYKLSYPLETAYVDNGVRAKIDYKATWPVNHETGFTTAVGLTQPLIQWEQLTPAAQDALETTDFGSATVPFKSNFLTNLAGAYFQ
jgi:hypothetical protein